MKRILITGKNGYIARHFDQFLRQFPNEYRVTSVSLRDGAWRGSDLSQYDVILHTAGIAHIRETSENAHLYYEVNRDLTMEAAQKAKRAGVGQFIFLSSASVYGMEEGVITRETEPHPVSHYGRSKLQAEEGLHALRSDNFRISILRPPTVYGEGCKGNYQTLVKLAGLVPIFPSYRNQRSMVSIDTLCRYIKDIVDRKAEGIFFPQEDRYVCTSDMVRELAAERGRHIYLASWLDPAVFLAKRCTRAGRKAFGNLIYQGNPHIEAF